MDQIPNNDPNTPREERVVAKETVFQGMEAAEVKARVKVAVVADIRVDYTEEGVMVRVDEDSEEDFVVAVDLAVEKEEAAD